MSASLLDVNVLLALAWPNHQHHALAHDWFRHEGRHGWATCALTQLAFVRLSSNPAYTPAAVTPQDAAALLRQLSAHRAHQYWRGMPESGLQVFTHVLGHQQVVDAYLVHLAERHDAHLVTFDRRVLTHATAPASVRVIAG